MSIEVADLAVAIKITPGATSALVDSFPQILKQDAEVIPVDITITIYVAIYVPNALTGVLRDAAARGVRKGTFIEAKCAVFDLLCRVSDFLSEDNLSGQHPNWRIL